MEYKNTYKYSIFTIYFLFGILLGYAVGLPLSLYDQIIHPEIFFLAPSMEAYLDLLGALHQTLALRRT